jgi:16S rRNA pseudouridine516 synthase
VCKKLAQEGLLTICGEEVRKADVKIDVWEGMPYTVEDEEWEYMEKVYVMLHKPAGYECTNKAKVHPIVFDLLPLQLQERGVQCVGRLDQDTTGLLLLTDDGDLNHVLTSPKKSKKKVLFQ